MEDKPRQISAKNIIPMFIENKGARPATSNKGSYWLGNKALPSVTSVTKQISNTEILHRWKLKLMREHFVNDMLPQLRTSLGTDALASEKSNADIKQAIMKSSEAWQEVSQAAADKGTRTHDYIEKLIMQSDVRFTFLPILFFGFYFEDSPLFPLKLTNMI